MISIPDNKGRFFSVKFTTTIHGAKYTPAICYKLTSDVQRVVEEMAKGENPLARIYPEEVRFVTGVAYPVKKPGDGKAALRSSSASAPQRGSVPVSKPSSKKPGKRISIQSSNREFD
jgi:hypothetical protein